MLQKYYNFQFLILPASLRLVPMSFYQSYWLMSSPLHEYFAFSVAVYHYWRNTICLLTYLTTKSVCFSRFAATLILVEQVDFSNSIPKCSVPKSRTACFWGLFHFPNCSIWPQLAHIPPPASSSSSQFLTSYRTAKSHLTGTKSSDQKNKFLMQYRGPPQLGIRQ